MNFVLGLIFGTVAISKAPLLSSKTLQCTVGFVAVKLYPFCCSSLTSSISGMVSHNAVLSAMNSASVVDKAICVCSLEFHTIGQPA